MSGVLAAMAGVLAGGAGGGGSELDTEIVTVGEFIFGEEAWLVGYSQGTMGSISNGLFAPKSGATIFSIYMDVLASTIYFGLSGEHANSGWSNMRIGSRDYARSSGAHFAGAGQTQWSWSDAVNPFSGIGTNTNVSFT